MFELILSFMLETNRCLPWLEGCEPRNVAEYTPPPDMGTPDGRCSQPTDECENKA